MLFTETDRSEADNTEEILHKAHEILLARAEATGRKPAACVVTFGCQMNARDSEKIRGILANAGYSLTDEEKGADLVLYNTCTVRENADQHVYGRLGQLSHYRKKNPGMIVALCGCMMQEEHVVERIRKSYPFVDLIFGTHNLTAFPSLLLRTLRMKADDEKGRVIEILEETRELPEKLPVVRSYSFKSGVNIMYGCNNFCSYCIVPYVRGREISRPREDILDEIRRLAADGVREVMLLGQNVNSYGKDSGDRAGFSSLLREVCRVDGIERVRFMTSHPKDLSDELISVMAEEDRIARHLHLPAQSGSDRILAKMNRHYTSDQYKALVRKLREADPDISLTTDIIVGFPGETEEDFEDTLRLVKDVGFDSAFTFLYSKRTGTPAAVMPDQVPEETKSERFQRLLEEVKNGAEKSCGRFLGRTMEVLCEEKDRVEGRMTGRISHNIVVHFPGTPEDIGKFVPVLMDDFRGFYYNGERAGDAR